MIRRLKSNSAFARPRQGPSLFFVASMTILGLYAGLFIAVPARSATVPDNSMSSTKPRLHPALPPGLPDLPAIGERMSTDDLSGFALRGFDPVAYFVSGQPTAGLADYEYSWDGAVWRFRSEANRAAFIAEPQVYAPLFDGYDAIAIGEDRIVASEPQTFAIIGGRLYFFRTEARRDAFRADVTLLNRSAEAWPRTMRQLSR
jgi:YHS domain-containing protein